MKNILPSRCNNGSVRAWFPTGTAIVGILALSTSLCRADHITEFLSVNLTALIPGETVDVTRGRGEDAEVIGSKTLKPEKVKLNNKVLLKWLDAPSGSKLVLIDGEEVGTKRGSEDSVRTGYFVSITEPDVEIVQGQETEVEARTRTTTKSKFTSRFVTTVTVEGSGVGVMAASDSPSGDFGFSVTGLATEKDSSSLVEREDSAKSKDSFSFSLSGAGNGFVRDGLDTFEALISGRIKSSGRGSLTETFDEK